MRPKTLLYIHTNSTLLPYCMCCHLICELGEGLTYDCKKLIYKN